MNTNNLLFDYVSASPTPYHAIEETAKRLEKSGFIRLYENEVWSLTGGSSYYVVRNGSSLIAFRTPTSAPQAYMITAAHCDAPCFKIKDNAELCDSSYIRLSTEKYGGMLCSTWLDRPLSVAGRVAVRTDSGFNLKLVNLPDCALIPNVAIHMNRNANDSMSYNAAQDMIALLCDADNKKRFKARIAEAACCSESDIVASDLFLCNNEHGKEWGDYISAPRLDDLQCAFSAMNAVISAEPNETVSVFCLFDNEEVGSQTKQGAASTFMFDTLERIATALGMDAIRMKNMISNSFLVSCDNAHAVHPNHPEFADKNHSVYMNRGIVIKHNANQRYTTDAVSAAIFRLVCEKENIPTQNYTNRADMPGGSTLGNIANTQVSLNTVDIGLAQLAMHSSYETAGAKDTDLLISALSKFYSCSIRISNDTSYEIR